MLNCIWKTSFSARGASNLAHSSQLKPEDTFIQALFDQKPATPLLGGKYDRKHLFLCPSRDKYFIQSTVGRLQFLLTKPRLKSAGNERLESLDGTCLVCKHSQEQAFVAHIRRIKAAVCCILLHSLCQLRSSIKWHEQPIFMDKCWVRTVAQRHSIIQLALFSANHGGVQMCANVNPTKTLKRLDQSFSPRTSTKLSSGMPECHPTSTVKVYKKAGTLSTERALHLYYSFRNKSGMWSDIDTERKKSGAGKEGE